MPTIKITHFSDILCIWAYIAEIRIDELEAEFSDRIALDFRLFPVFGNVPGKIHKQWRERGGIAAYNQHVQQIAARFDHLEVNPRVWLEHTPCSSIPAHLYLSAVRVAEQQGLTKPGSFLRYKKRLRKAFFAELMDIADRSVLSALAEETELPVTVIEGKIAGGEAFASLGEDLQLAKDMNITSSPTLLFNEDRQRLTGNVGYRIIEANVRELLQHPEQERSWC